MRSWPTAARRAAAGFAAVAVAVLLVLVAPRPDLALYPGHRLAFECAAVLALALLALSRSLRPLALTDGAPAVAPSLLALAGLFPWLLALSLHCPITAPVHLAAAHAAIAMALVLAWTPVTLWRRRAVG